MTCGSASCEGRHTAIVTIGKKVIGVGTNKYVRNCIRTSAPITTHAEVHALENAIRNTKKRAFALSVEVQRTDGKMSKPCFHCTEIMKGYGVKRVHYTIGDGLWESVSLSSLIGSSPQISSGFRAVSRGTLVADEEECDGETEEQKRLNTQCTT